MDLLTIENVSKSYGDVQVLKDIEMNIQKGEIHGLIGENGAGKSTLMNILFGMPVIHNTGGFEGKMKLDGVDYSPKTPQEAMDRGVGMVHQEFMLIPGFSITENIKLNRENTKPSFISKILGKKLEMLDRKPMREDAKKALDTLNLEIDEKQRVRGLPVGYMQFIEIAREIDKKNLKLLIVDEPTAVLTESEADQFLKILKRLASLGITILFITHRLDEIKEVCDSITVLRDGKVVSKSKIEDVTVAEMAKAMVGREIEIVEHERIHKENHETTLQISNLQVDMPGEEVKDFSINIRRGEILGIGGLAGQGKIGVANGIMGLYPASGNVIKDGEKLDLSKPRDMLQKGMAFLSEDRKGVGLLLDSPIDYNIAISAMEVKGRFLKKVGPFEILDKKEVESYGEQMIETLDIRCQSGKQLAGSLSGGNQQKVCIARALTLDPDILLVSEPTRGIDIGAKNLVLSTLRKINQERNVTIVITSSELGELRQIADRIAIVTDGKLQAILEPDAPDEKFGLAMAGNMEEVQDDCC
ncbi:MAG: sugar ABC transporter ATP-binding protein [Tissierellia bacterium]|nr:sugar ABC transporter ATP-binding protein [Tissierellia bacterium]